MSVVRALSLALAIASLVTLAVYEIMQRPAIRRIRAWRALERRGWRNRRRR